MNADKQSQKADQDHNPDEGYDQPADSKTLGLSGYANCRKD